MAWVWGDGEEDLDNSGLEGFLRGFDDRIYESCADDGDELCCVAMGEADIGCLG